LASWRFGELPDYLATRRVCFCYRNYFNINELRTLVENKRQLDARFDRWVFGAFFSLRISTQDDLPTGVAVALTSKSGAHIEASWRVGVFDAFAKLACHRVAPADG
jgi:hypothetical protein